MSVTWRRMKSTPNFRARSRRSSLPAPARSVGNPSRLGRSVEPAARCLACAMDRVPRWGVNQDGGTSRRPNRRERKLRGGLTVTAGLRTGRLPRPPVAPVMATPVAASGEVSGSAGAGVAAGPAPDISQMSPRERFDRLFNRIMQAAQQGDSAQVQRFTPMALGAYAQLDSVD